MPYKFQPGMIYRMPTHFGPALGLRQSETGPSHAPDSRDNLHFSVSFLTNREQLIELLPEGFEVGQEPVVTVDFNYMTNIKKAIRTRRLPHCVVTRMWAQNQIR